MSVFYELSGRIPLRRGPGFEGALRRVADLAGVDAGRLLAGDADLGMLEMSLYPDDALGDGVEVLAFAGGLSCAAGSAADLDDALRALGAYAVEPATVVYDYDGMDGFYAVAPTTEAAAAAESRHALDDIIMPAVGLLTVADAQTLATRLLAAIPEDAAGAVVRAAAAAVAGGARDGE